MAKLFDKLKMFINSPSYMSHYKYHDLGPMGSNNYNFAGTNRNAGYERANGHGFKKVSNAQMYKYWANKANKQERCLDYDAMDADSIISNALDILSDDIVSQDMNNNIINIKCDNEKIVEDLENLFHNILNIEFNLWFWSRNMLKYGDSFVILNIHEEMGIIDSLSVPVNMVERVEGEHNNSDEIYFKFQGAASDKIENYEMLHFRIIGDDNFYPYGRSMLESARRTWKQLRLLEDSMLVYRVTRAPERRIFYIEVGNLSPEAAESYIEEVKMSLSSNPVVDPESGEIDMRYGPAAINEDYYIPTRGGVEMNRIDTLAGGSNSTDIEDVELILNKLLSALKVPKAFLGYEESLNSRTTLASEDIRYSRTVQRFQKMIIEELYKAAFIHLFVLGYSEDDINSFEINLFNPSSIADLQKLEIMQQKVETAGAMKEFFSEEYIYKEVFEMTEDEIKIERNRRLNEMKFTAIMSMLENASSIEDFDNISFKYEDIFNELEKAQNKIDINDKNKSELEKENNKLKEPVKPASMSDIGKDMADSAKPKISDSLMKKHKSSNIIRKQFEKNIGTNRRLSSKDITNNILEKINNEK